LGYREHHEPYEQGMGNLFPEIAKKVRNPCLE
jgi:hypothetical protein